MSTLGPTIIFDKSLLQSLSEDESVWLDAFYHSIITPLFYIETLADLKKETNARLPEDIVRIIANKVPEMSSSPNTHHRELCIANLLGHEISFSRRPVLNGGKFYTLNNKIGVVYDEHPEIQAFQRWQKQEFLEIEKEIASLWRNSLVEFDYDYFLKKIQEITGSSFQKPKSVKTAFNIATSIINGHGDRFKTLQLLRELLNINSETFKRVTNLWSQEDMVPIGVFAPYSSHVLKVDIFFILCISNGLISRVRKSNRADVAYLYYLPFTNIFTSCDNLHKRIVPLFLESDQRFIAGEDLKDDLSKLDQYFDELKTKKEKSDGVYSFAWYPPNNDRFLTARMWDDLRPKWRLIENSPRSTGRKNQNVPEGLKDHIKKAYEETRKQEGQRIPPEFNLEKADDVIVKRQIRGRRGKWQLFSDEILNSKERLMDDDSKT